MAARKNKVTLSDTWRDRIKTGVIMERLESCANGSIEMTSAQLKAAQILLSKIVPDLSRTDVNSKHSGNLTIEIVKFEDSHTS